MLARLESRIWVLLYFFLASPVLALAQEVTVSEVAMAAPDIVFVELRDPPFARGKIVAMGQPRSEEVGTWVKQDGEWGLVIGPNRDRLRLQDTLPGAFLDRALVDDASAYAPIGGRKVIAVYRKSMPYASGLFRGEGGDTQAGASFKHSLYLKLDGPLPPGSHAIEGPRPVDGARIAFDDRLTRAVAIRATQMGHRRTDVAKVAYLSLWLPGGRDQGAVDFRRYGINRFKVLDDKGREVFSAPIGLRPGPVEPEPGNGLPGDLLDYAEAAALPVPLADMDGLSFATSRPHGLRQGQRIALQRLRGDEDASATFATVSGVTETTFDVTDIGGELPTDFARGATVTPAHSANRAGTYVFELDYSAWIPAQDGIYRLQVPGLGVSDPISMDEGVWLKSARLSIAGLYHHRSGIALDGRFGYERPAAFRPGAALTIRESRLPLSWSSEFGGFVPFEEGAKPAWITDRVAPESYWGGYMDAGDWDRRIQHVEVAALLLEVFENTPLARRNVDLGVPRSSEVLDDAIYAGTDGLPDLIHEAIWGMDFFRRLQMPDGSVRGGIESAAHPLKGEPSFLEHRQVFAYAPDPVSTYKYAAVAAKLARILGDLGSLPLASVYQDSAISAWSAAERGFADPDGVYAEAIEAAEGSGAFSGAPWQERKRVLQELAGEYRAAAGAALLRLTNEPDYATPFEEQWGRGQDLYAYKGDAAWDYLNTAYAASDLKAQIRDAFLREAAMVVAAQQRLAYPGLKHPAAPAGWGQGGAPDYSQMQTLMRAHQLGGNATILAAMERAHHALLGANQLGLSLMTGAGIRQATNPLHEDSIAMGVPAPVGITIYGWASQAQTAHGWIFGPWWSPLAEVGPVERRIEPPRFSLPYYEYLVEHPALVMQQEYTVQQTISTMAALALYLNAQ